MNRYEELKAAIKSDNTGKHYLKQRDPSDYVEELCAEIDGLRLTLAALQSSAQKGAEDGKRLDWLEANSSNTYPTRIGETLSGQPWITGEYGHFPGESLRDAIDRALSAAKPEASP